MVSSFPIHVINAQGQGLDFHKTLESTSSSQIQFCRGQADTNKATVCSCGQEPHSRILKCGHTSR